MYVNLKSTLSSKMCIVLFCFVDTTLIEWPTKLVALKHNGGVKMIAGEKNVSVPHLEEGMSGSGICSGLWELFAKKYASCSEDLAN